MTNEELEKLRHRVSLAKTAQQNLQLAEAFLLKVQGHGATEKHEEVAHHLIDRTKRPPLRGLNVLDDNNNWQRFAPDNLMLSAEMQEHVCALARLLVKQYREELAAL